MDLSTYTTSELARLVTLNEATMKQGEYAKLPAAARIGVALRLEDGNVAFCDGSYRCAHSYGVQRFGSLSRISLF